MICCFVDMRNRRRKRLELAKAADEAMVEKGLKPGEISDPMEGFKFFSPYHLWLISVSFWLGYAAITCLQRFRSGLASLDIGIADQVDL